MIIYIAVNKKEIPVKEFVINIINWFIGYGLIWISKWIIVDLLCDRNILQQAWGNVLYRSKNIVGFTKINFIDVITQNISYVELEVLISFILVELIIMMKCICKIKTSWKEVFQYLAISAMPFIWYYFTQNHSYIHGRFTYRILLITLLSLGILIYKITRRTIKKFF